MKTLIFTFLLVLSGLFSSGQVTGYADTTIYGDIAWHFRVGTGTTQEMTFDFTPTYNQQTYNDTQYVMMGGGAEMGIYTNQICGTIQRLKITNYTYDIHQFLGYSLRQLDTASFGVQIDSLTISFTADPCPPVPVNYGGLIYNKKGKPNNGHGH